MNKAEIDEALDTAGDIIDGLEGKNVVLLYIVAEAIFKMVVKLDDHYLENAPKFMTRARGIYEDRQKN